MLIFVFLLLYGLAIAPEVCTFEKVTSQEYGQPLVEGLYDLNTGAVLFIRFSEGCIADGLKD